MTEFLDGNCKSKVYTFSDIYIDLREKIKMKMNKFSSFLVVLVLYNYLGMQNMPDIENASESTYSRYKFGIGLFHRRF